MVTVTRIFTFDSAHHLPNYDGKCSYIHGHTYKLEVTVGGDIITDVHSSEYGMIIDFNKLDRLIKECIVDVYDHKLLNEFFAYPTAEVMVESIGKKIRVILPQNVDLVSVRLWEKIDSSYAEYTP